MGGDTQYRDTQYREISALAPAVIRHPLFPHKQLHKCVRVQCQFHLPFLPHRSHLGKHNLTRTSNHRQRRDCLLLYMRPHPRRVQELQEALDNGVEVGEGVARDAFA